MVAQVTGVPLKPVIFKGYQPGVHGLPGACKQISEVHEVDLSLLLLFIFILDSE